MQMRTLIRQDGEVQSKARQTRKETGTTNRTRIDRWRDRKEQVREMEREKDEETKAQIEEEIPK